MEPCRLLQALLTLLILISSSCGGLIESEQALKMDQALIIFHNYLPHEVEAFYTSDHCYKCVYQHLVNVKGGNNNASAVISTKFTLTLRVESRMRNTTVCRWSQTYGEGGHYSVWIGTPDEATDPSCNHTVDRKPNNTHLREWMTEVQESVKVSTVETH